jgi:hypothetical protein
MSLSITAYGAPPPFSSPEELPPVHEATSLVARSALLHPKKEVSGLKFEHPLSTINIIKKSLVLKICELPRLTSQAMSNIFKKVRESLSSLFAIKQIDKRLADELDRLNRLQMSPKPDNKRITTLKWNIESLRIQKKKWCDRLLRIRKAPPGFFAVISTCVTAIYTLGAITKSMGDAAMAGLKASCTWIGSISGAISILFGGAEIAISIAKIRTANQELNSIETTLNKLENTHRNIAPESIWNCCRDLQTQKLLIQNLKAIRSKRKAIFQILMGSFAIAGGIIGIASLCTSGWAAIGLSIAGGVAGLAGIGIAIYSYIRSRPLSQKIKDFRTQSMDDVKILADKIQQCTPLQKEELAALLNVDAKDLEQPHLVLKTLFAEVISKEQ